MNDNPATSSGPYAAGTFTPDQSVGHLMRQVLNSIRSQADARLAPCDMTYVQWLPLYKLMLQEGATTASLARELAIDPGAMTRSVDRLARIFHVCSQRPAQRGIAARI